MRTQVLRGQVQNIFAGKTLFKHGYYQIFVETFHWFGMGGGRVNGLKVF
jgi:hypothetical protein